MADLTFVPANLTTVSGTFSQVTSGEALNQCEFVRQLSGKMVKAIANVDANSAAVAGMIVTTVAATNQLCLMMTGGTISIASFFTSAVLYILSATTAGKIAPYADLVSTNYITYIGTASSDTLLPLSFKRTGLQKA